MATVVLATVGRVVGSAIGGPIGGQIGQAIGATIGGTIDAALFSPTVQGPRLREVQITTSTEGAGITRLYGRCRLGGQLIWATKFKERKVSSSSGGKGGQKSANFTYSVSFAVAFCEGNERATIGRVWADGKVIDLSGYTTRWYPGSLTQSADSYIQSIEGADNVSAYRGTAYMVFEDMDLTDFGNRIPQITAEVTVPIDAVAQVEELIEGVTLIPATGSFTYATEPYIVSEGLLRSNTENVHNGSGIADVMVSLDQLEAGLPNCDTVAVVVSWFGDDLRAGECNIRPRLAAAFEGVELIAWRPTFWNVDGQGAGAVPLVSEVDGKSVYGSTPADESIRQIITELKARGKRVIFYPFILMDIQTGNGLPDPYGGSEQAANPWRGRITCMPAPGEAGTVDKTATAGTQIDTFFTRTWGFSRFINHYADLCAEVGGVDVFLIGSEMVGVSTVRSSAGTFPAIAQLQTIAASVKGKLPAAEVSYAADWSEYHSYRPADGTGDVYFHLDPLWADSNIDFIGIDNYLPIADVHTGSALDIYDLDYLKSQIESGEYFDYYYASLADREAGTQTPITDGAYNKPWVFRNKDIRNWWSEDHYNRPAGVESASPTAFVPEAKPIWFTEFGCPAVDRGPNQPNVFYDPKSSESFFPYFSTGVRDDQIQRQYLQAMISYWTAEAPVSIVYAGPMVSPSNMIVWTWDARPYPAFPTLLDVWSDGPNYERGHWINGRIGSSSPLGDLVRAIASRTLDNNLIDTSALVGQPLSVTGYYSTQIASPRDDLAPLLSIFACDAHESGGLVRFVLRSNAATIEVDQQDLVPAADSPTGYQLNRAQPFELPGRYVLTFVDELNDFQTASAPGLLEKGGALDVASVSYPIVLRQQDAKGIADMLLQDAWLSQERASFRVPPSLSLIEPGDVLKLGNLATGFRITKGDFGGMVALEGVGTDTTAYTLSPGSEGNPGRPTVPTIFGPVTMAILDIPLVTGQESEPQAPRLASFASPWPGTVSVLRANNSGGYNQNATVPDPSTMGTLVAALPAGNRWGWDDVNTIEVELFGDTELVSIDDLDTLQGQNAIAVQSPSGLWEIVCFSTATLTGTRTYSLTRLLRGKLGTENEMDSAPYPIGSSVVLLDADALGILGVSLSDRTISYAYRYGPARYAQDSITYNDVSYASQAVGLRPYAPVGVKAVRDLADDSITFSWVRRTRFGGDSWDDPVPLNEESEAYELDIVLAGTVLRTLSSTTPSVVYSAAQQIEDFGSLPSMISVAVYQMSATIGRGAAAERDLNAD